MKEAFDLIKERLEERKRLVGHFSRYNHDMYVAGVSDEVEVALTIVSEVEAEYINKSTEHINKSSDCSTNGDKIRAMSDEELAEWVFKHDGIVHDFGRMTKSETLRWMKSPAE